MAGTDSRAFTTAHPIRWVKLTFPPPAEARNRLITRRFSSSSFAGRNRNDVAVGISSEADMFAAIRAAAPLSGDAPGGASVAAGGAVAVRSGGGASAGAAAWVAGGAVSVAGGAAWVAGAESGSPVGPDPSPEDSAPSLGLNPSKNSFQAAPTESGSSRYRR